MPIPLAVAAGIATLIGAVITVGKIGTDYANDEAGFERLRGDMKTAARQNDYVIQSYGKEEYFFLHRDDWKNPSLSYLVSSGYTNSAIEAMKVFVLPSSEGSLCRCASFRPIDGFFSNEWITTTWSFKERVGLSKKVYTTDTAGCSALFEEKYINGDLAMQRQRRDILEKYAFA